MRITQGYVSKSVMDFPFHQIYTLDDYNDYRLPAVFFGMYRYEDVRVFADNGSERVIFWTGQDALDATEFPFKNVTAHPKVAERIRSFGFECELVKPSSFLNDFCPEVLGINIYAYCPNSAPDYHGKKVLDELKKAGYNITIGDGSISQQLWRHTRNAFYNDICIGLCLSSFAGGGTSIIEMGLRGVNVVTNVFDLPNCIKWPDNGDVEQSAQYIAGLIEKEKSKIGQRNAQLAKDVWDSLDHEFKWLEI